jgi:peptide deformylase
MLGGAQRHVSIKVEAQDVNGEQIQRTYTDWTARIFQHEYDHLQVCQSCAP